MFETVNYSLAENIATITMNRPEALNALSARLCADLRDAIRQVEVDNARSVVLTGAGRAFCSGGDLREMLEIGKKQGSMAAFLDAPLKALHAVILSIRQSPVPFVAAVNGPCAGAGTNFALACDMVVAADTATFNEAFVRIGLSPDCGGTFFLPRAVGEKRAAELLMTGKTIAAREALELGLINRVCPPDDLAANARTLALELSAGPTAVIGRIKRMLNNTFANSLEQQMALEAECQLESGVSPDFREGVKAFFERRAPDFKGE